MKVLFITRDVKAGIGATVRNIILQLEKLDLIEVIGVIAPGKFEVYTDKVHFYEVPTIGKYFFISEPMFGFYVSKLLPQVFKEYNFDIVHVHSNIIDYSFFKKCKINKVISTIQGTHKALLNMDFPVISTFHMTHFSLTKLINFSRLKYAFGKYLHLPFIFLDKHRVKNSNLITCVSELTKLEILKYHLVEPSRVSFIPNEVDTDIYRPIPIKTNEYIFNKYGIKTKKNILLYIGRIESGKGIPYLIEAMNSLQDCSLLLVGPNQETIKTVNTDVHYLGSVYNESEKNLLINCSTIFVYPSLYENFPLSICEAISAGKPVLATNVGMIPFILQNNKLQIIKPGSSEEIVKGIKRLLNSDNELSTISKQNRDFAVESLNWRTVTFEYIKLYKKITNEI